jgi:hypothetical protein
MVSVEISPMRRNWQILVALQLGNLGLKVLYDTAGCKTLG